MNNQPAQSHFGNYGYPGLTPLQQQQLQQMRQGHNQQVQHLMHPSQLQLQLQQQRYAQYFTSQQLQQQHLRRQQQQKREDRGQQKQDSQPQKASLGTMDIAEQAAYQQSLRPQQVPGMLGAINDAGGQPARMDPRVLQQTSPNSATNQYCVYFENMGRTVGQVLNPAQKRTRRKKSMPTPFANNPMLVPQVKYPGRGRRRRQVSQKAHAEKMYKQYEMMRRQEAQGAILGYPRQLDYGQMPSTEAIAQMPRSAPNERTLFNWKEGNNSQMQYLNGQRQQPQFGQPPAPMMGGPPGMNMTAIAGQFFQSGTGGVIQNSSQLAQQRNAQLASAQQNSIAVHQDGSRQHVPHPTSTQPPPAFSPPVNAQYQQAVQSASDDYMKPFWDSLQLPKSVFGDGASYQTAGGRVEDELPEDLLSLNVCDLIRINSLESSDEDRLSSSPGSGGARDLEQAVCGTDNLEDQLFVPVSQNGISPLFATTGQTPEDQPTATIELPCENTLSSTVGETSHSSPTPVNSPAGSVISTGKNSPVCASSDEASPRDLVSSDEQTDNANSSGYPVVGDVPESKVSAETTTSTSEKASPSSLSED